MAYTVFINLVSTLVNSFQVLYSNRKKFFALKSDSHAPKKKLFICFNDNPSKMMKNAFYFALKAFLVLKIFKFLS